MRNGGDDPVTGDPSREYGIVPVHGLASGASRARMRLASARR
ncbi:MAG: hypothetical protein ACRDQY_15945 [Pseudonocardiaceae bacterium]